jgi:hypothetical protein
MFPNGRWVRIDPRNPDAVARCDRSGQLCNYNDLVKQMDYRGTGLIWTGLYVNKHFLDVPNPQSLNPILKPDPVPVEHPRPWQQTQDTYQTEINQWQTQVMPPWSSWGDLEQNT